MPCRCACASGSLGARSTAAGAAPRRSCRLRRRTAPFPVACRPRGCWLTWRCRNTTTACRCTARSWSATASISTLSDWMGRTAWWLKPLWELLLGSVLSSPKLFCDDTRLPVLAPGKGKTSTGYLWGLARDDSPWRGDLPPAVAYVYTEDRVWD